MQGPCKK